MLMPVKILLLLTFLVISMVLSLAVLADTADTKQFIGRSVCTECHQKQASQWAGSHHDLAMQQATGKTVLGDFANASLTQFGVTSTFFRNNKQFMVRTEGADGKLHDYSIKYTFGVEPLQQYLIEFPGGRLQALSLAWDSRSKNNGGQRWFHLYPDEKIAFDDELHWTKPSQNWNSMCAECHSTHLEKNYDSVNKSFKTTWSEINVSCEACHGPGSDHLKWAQKKSGWEKFKPSKGLRLLLDERQNINWKINPKTGNATRSKTRSTSKEIEMCARCHSRRSAISDGFVHGEPLLDHYLPRLLDQGVYFADGQIEGEVYVYGSFLQSKMHQAGVTCSDCHEPHSLKLRAPDNGVCLQCHQSTRYNQSSHHFHQQKSKGASCAECHMPPRNYMVVDPRHDHSIRIPRPDLSVKLGTPNACNNCHTDKKPEWAAKQVNAWYGHTPSGFQSYAQALSDARHEQPGAGDALAVLIRDVKTPDIARATALSQIGPRLSATTINVLTDGLWDDDPAVRAATARTLEFAPPGIRARLAFMKLDDPVRAVRIELARSMLSVPADSLSPDQRSLLDKVLQEYIASQQANAERPEAQTNLGILYATQGQTNRAVKSYNTAIELNSAYTPAYVNLADLYRATNNETEAERILRRAIKVTPESADVHHALGLSLIRQKRVSEAIGQLQLATKLNPGNTRYVYVYAVALNSTGKAQQAVMVLQGAHTAHPANAQILSALVAFLRDMGKTEASRVYAEKLRAVLP